MPLRISHKAGMSEYAKAVIDALGGTTAVARMADTPVSTVHSWREIGIPASRIAHLRLIAQSEGKDAPDDSAIAMERAMIAAIRKTSAA